VWRGRRRIRRLEEEVATARAEQAELERRLEVFEKIAGAVGGSLPESAWWGTAVPAAPMPATLAAAAREQLPQDAPVRLEVAGSDVIAVIGGPGDPRQWWSALWQIAVPSGEVP
jgi:hypothetical protein